MGTSISWLATRGITCDITLERLGLRQTGETTDGAGKHAFTGGAMPGGWSLVVARGCDHPMVSASRLALLSANCELVACSVEEHMMACSAEHWSQGLRLWRVAHDAQRGRAHLDTAGTLPSDFEGVRNTLAAQQAAEDAGPAEVDFWFELPLVLAQTRTGFKHDEDSDLGPDDCFQVLAPAASAAGQRHAQAWWKFWR